MSELPKAQHWFAPGVNTIRDTMVKAFEAAKALAVGYPVEVIVRPVKSRRGLLSNAKMWAMLGDVSKQVQWPVNGAMVWMTPDEWKDVLSAAYTRESVKVAMGLDGGMVMLGSRTSKFSVREMSEFIEFLHATAAARDVDVRYREYA